MTTNQFAYNVVMECKKRSMMTYTFSKRGYRKFRHWFFKYGKKRMGWSKWKAIDEFQSFVKAFNITIE